MSAPRAYRWDGDALIPLRPKIADAEMIVDKIYWLVEAADEASSKSRRHMFAVLRKGWENLPEAYKDEFPDPEFFRKRALIATDFFDETRIKVGDQATAGQIAVSLRRRDRYAEVFVHDGYIIERTAKSQKRMKREQFEASKKAILGLLADLVGVSVDELSKESERTT